MAHARALQQVQTYRAAPLTVAPSTGLFESCGATHPEIKCCNQCGMPAIGKWSDESDETGVNTENHTLRHSPSSWVCWSSWQIQAAECVRLCQRDQCRRPPTQASARYLDGSYPLARL